jgi:hypothetical protein
MKVSGTLLAIALGTALQTDAAPPAQNASASNNVETNAIPSKLVSLQPTAKKQTQIERVGNMSSRPWAEIVGWHPGMSQFPDAENHESQLTLFSFRFGPKHHQQSAISRQSPQP